MFLAFFSVPKVNAPLVSICLEPNIFYQGSNASWISITIALCGGILFPMIGFSFVKNNIILDRNSGLLYILQSMNMKKVNYVVGKFLSNLFILTVMWIFVIIGAALMIPFQFPNQTLDIYDFISPFIGIYPGIIFTSAFAVILESISFISNKAGNAIGLTVLFVIFLINYSTSDYNNPMIRVFDYSNYRWVMDSINNVVMPIIGRGVNETGILVPGGMFADSKGGQELFFHGLLWSGKYFVDKFVLIAISVFIILLAVILLEKNEKNTNSSLDNLHKKERTGRKKIYCTNQFISEYRMILKNFPKSCYVVVALLWVCSIFVPLNYVEDYLWIIMLIFLVTLFSQMGCREYENNLTEYFTTIRFSLIKQMAYSYLSGAMTLLILSAPIIIRCFIERNLYNSLCYIAFSIFVPALACFLGEFSKSRRAFETIYLLLCFLMLNMPSFIFQEYMLVIMTVGTIFLIFVTSIRRAQLEFVED
jgi:hypothetical protein